MTLPSDRIMATTRAQQSVEDRDVLTRGIMSHLTQINANKEGSTTPFINNLGITKVFKDEDKEEEVSVIDLIR